MLPNHESMPNALLPDARLVRVEHVAQDRDHLILVAVSCRATVPCPVCGCPASRVHSRYSRSLTDLPWSGVRVRLQLRTRRFFCDQPDCARQIFTERLPGLVRPRARRSARLWDRHQFLAHALGGEPGARVAAELAIQISPDTLLAQLKQAPAFAGPAPRVLGVDDFAFRKGLRSGTVLIDLERGQPVDLLPDRKGETLTTWLQEHPGVEIATRDRGGNYAEGLRQGAPDAEQVADRWHLLKNLVEALEASLAREQQALAQAAGSAPEAPTELEPEPVVPPLEVTEPPAPEPPARGPTRAERDRTTRRERRRRVYDEVWRLHQEGHTQREIARRTGKARHTVRKYLRGDAFPESKCRRPRPTQLLPYHAYLHERWEAGCHNAAQLFREIQERGYVGGVTEVRRYLAARRARLPPEERRTSGPQPHGKRERRPPAPRTVVWWLLRAPEQLTAGQSRFLSRLKEHCATVATAQTLAVEFFRIVRQREPQDLNRWLERAEQSGVSELRTFARGLRRDGAAVEAALRCAWSNGPVEGQVHRLKLVKRSMYGRASFALLRARVLPRQGTT